MLTEGEDVLQDMIPVSAAAHENIFDLDMCDWFWCVVDFVGNMQMEINGINWIG